VSPLDYIVIVIYIVAVIVVGTIMQRYARQGIDAYFLGQRSLPWWALGASGMASNLDVTGTMINTAFIFTLGAMGFFIEIRGGVVLIMAFLMVFMGKWNRRAQVMTLAEWMRFRFGEGRQGNIARLISAISMLVMTIAMITYFCIGAGKFIGEFLGIPAFAGLPSQFWAAALMIFLAMIYTVTSGLYGVVWTDVFQGLLIFGTIIFICIMAVTQFSLPETFQVSMPMKDGTFQTIETTREAWTSFIPDWQLGLPEASAYSIYNLFGIAILFYLFKVTIEGSGGAWGYMLQRYLAARSDRDAGLLSMLWTVLLAFRWSFIASIAIMGICIGMSGQVIDDPETVLPVVVNQLIPIGFKGLIIAGLMAASMSTFDSTVNSGASYWVKDIYQTFINPNASNRQLMLHSRGSSILIVVIGLLFSLLIKNINEIWGWITMSISGGLFIPLVVRWYWWRLNGYGFAAGTAAGMVAAVLQKAFFPDIPEYVSFAFSASTSLLFMVLVTVLTRPTDKSVLENFYKITRPFGFWNPVRNALAAAVLEKINAENLRDRIAVCLAVPWQMALFISLMMVVMKRFDNFAILFTIVIVLSIGLYFFWYRHLSDEVKVDDTPES